MGHRESPKGGCKGPIHGLLTSIGKDGVLGFGVWGIRFSGLGVCRCFAKLYNELLMAVRGCSRLNRNMSLELQI